MIRTHGLAHISLAVRDPERSLRFYETLFGVVEYCRDQESIQAKSAAGWEVLAFNRDPDQAGQPGGIGHFGFRLIDAADMAEAREAVVAPGGKVIDEGEHGPGFPYLYISDPDGYEVEIWYE